MRRSNLLETAKLKGLHRCVSLTEAKSGRHLRRDEHSRTPFSEIVAARVRFYADRKFHHSKRIAHPEWFSPKFVVVTQEPVSKTLVSLKYSNYIHFYYLYCPLHFFPCRFRCATHTRIESARPGTYEYELQIVSVHYRFQKIRSNA